MPEIKFKCPACDQDLEAPEDMAGETVECPTCETQLSVPVAAPAEAAISQPAISGEDSENAGGNDTACPSCGVEMPADAVLCMHCGYNIKLGKKMETSFE